ncbi:MAG: NTP transferase domain-containing protein [bacterium]
MAAQSEGAITGILLCGGKSSRMGVSKADLALGGQPLLEIAIEKLKRLCNAVLLVSREKAAHRHSDITWIADDPLGKGPVAGVLAGLKAMKTDLAISLGLDQPFIPVSLLSYLCEQRSGFDVVMPVAEKAQPLSAVYSRRAIYGFEARMERNRFDLHGILDEKILKRRRVEARELARFGDPIRMFFNLNTPEDYETAKLWWRGLDYDRLMDKGAQAMGEIEVGHVEHYFGKIGVAAVMVTAGDLKIGDTIVIRGHSGELRQTVSSMQLEHQPVTEAKPGQSVGLMVTGKVHEHDKVFQVTPD